MKINWKEFKSELFNCPYCQSKNINSGQSENTGENLILVPVQCEDCNKGWVEEFTFNQACPDQDN